MGYFGGLGAGKGWHKFHFIITPDELYDVLNKGYCFVIDNRRSLLDYKDTELSEYILHYRKYFHRISTGKEFNRKIDWKYTSPLHISITHDRSIYETQVCPDPKYRVFNAREPVINVRAFEILRTEKGISVDIYHGDGFVGLALFYPKIVSFDSEGHEYLYETNEYQGLHIYNTIVNDIKSITKGCKMEVDSKLYRPRIKISNASKDLINNSDYLKNNNIVIL